ncbi:MAG: Ribbon-helix-helix protein, copG family [uncultured Acidilobus sp. JCHS]|nr:MAG: Ribbon-helix-helix protein, copG family [uncultured Acidilobus sp. JCHS]
MTLVKLVTVKMPDLYVRAIDELVKEERYSSRSEVIRVAVRELLKRELWRETLVADEVEVGELEAVEVS